MNALPIRHRLQALHDECKLYPFLDLGWQYLSVTASDTETARQVMDALLDIELGGVARELLQLRADLRSDPQQTSQWQERIRRVPSGRIAWSELRANFEANRQCLLRCHSQGAEIDSQLADALTGLHLFRTRHGHYLLSSRQPGQYRRWLPGLTDYAHDEQVELPDMGPGTPLFIDGLSLGNLLQRVLERTAEMWSRQSPPILVVESNAALLAAWLHVREHTALLENERVYFYCGAQALERLEASLNEQDDLATAPACVITPPGANSQHGALMDLHQRVVHRRQALLKDIEKQLLKRAEDRSERVWQQRLRTSGPIMAMTSRTTTMLQYSVRDIGAAFAEMGHPFHLLIEASEHRQLTQLQVAKAMLEVDPVLFVMVDHLRYELGHLYQVPVLTWVQDPLPNLLRPEAGASIGPLDFVCGYYRERCVHEFGYPAERFFEACVPASNREFHDRPLDPEAQRQAACDVMYVGHMGNTADGHVAHWLEESNPAVRPLLQTVAETILQLRAAQQTLRDPAALVHQISAAMGIQLADAQLHQLSNFFAYRLFDIHYRHETLGWVAAWAERSGRTLKIYGSGWETHPILKRFAAGPLEHGEALRQAYRGARLALQTIPAGFTHQRSLEALLSGALVLARYTPADFAWQPETQFGSGGLTEAQRTCPAAMFPNLRQVIFRSPEEFEKLAEHYLVDDSSYHNTRREFQEIVLRRYTYSANVPRIMQQIREALDPCGLQRHILRTRTCTA